jgi:hypothetical protein
MSTAVEIENEVENAVEVEPQRRRFTVEKIPEYRAVDLPRNRVVVHRRPQTGVYRDLVECGIEESFASPVFGGRTIAARDLLSALGT